MDLYRTIIALPLLLISAPLTAAGLDVFELRNQHPFLHVYGLPPLQQAMLVERGQPGYAVVLSIVNNSEIKDTETESVVLDGETYFADFRFRRRIHERLEIGLDVPLVKHSRGFLDRMIYDWHDFWGISNSKRGEPHNQLDYAYQNNGSVQQRVTASSFGVGDVQLSAAMPLVAGGATGSRHVSLRFTVAARWMRRSAFMRRIRGACSAGSFRTWGSRDCWGWETAMSSRSSKTVSCPMEGWRAPGMPPRASASPHSFRRRARTSTTTWMNWAAARFN